MKERITITIDSDLLGKIDDQVDGVNVKNRSHAIELSLSRVLDRTRIKQAIILAGGPYEVKQNGRSIPTTMVQINNKPVLEHNILNLKKQGVSEIILAVGHKKDLIKNYFGDGSKFGVSIHYIEDDQPQGTAGVLKNAAQYVTGPFTVSNGDVLKAIDVKDMFEFHKKQGTLATIALTTVNDPQQYGVVILNGNRVHSFVEKPQSSIPTNLINAGFYIFEPEVLNEIPQGYAKLEVDVFPKLANKEEFAGYVFYGKWNYVRTKELLEQAIQDW